MTTTHLKHTGLAPVWIDADTIEWDGPEGTHTDVGVFLRGHGYLTARGTMKQAIALAAKIDKRLEEFDDLLRATQGLTDDDKKWLRVRAAWDVMVYDKPENR